MPRDARTVALEKARPCPWCGGTKHLTLSWVGAGIKERWQVVCQSCSADGPIGIGMIGSRKAMAEAVSAWNNREAA